MRFRHIAIASVLTIAIVAVGEGAVTNRTRVTAPTKVRYEPVTGSDRVFYEASHLNRGTTTPVKEADLIRLCGDQDGCTIRMGMYNWDNTERVASREFLFFYNKTPNNRTWRSSYGDAAGTNSNSTVEHVAGPIWSCYF